MSKTTAAKLIIHQRTDWEQTLTPPVLPLPDASWGARCQIRDAAGVLLAEPLATVEPDGDIRLELGRSLTNIRPSSSHAYDVLLESPGGDRDKFFSGQVTVVGTITQWGMVPPVIPGAPPDPIPAWLSGVVGGAIANHNANLAAHPGLITGGGGGGISSTREVFTLSNGQTVFTLAEVPVSPQLSYLFLNGVKMRFALDYTVNGANVNWQNRVQLQVTDEFEVFYQYNASLAGNVVVLSRTVFTPSNGQTSFTLAAVPASPQLSYLFLNGVKARFILDYTINGAIVNWQNRVQLETSDEFEIFYQ